LSSYKSAQSIAVLETLPGVDFDEHSDKQEDKAHKYHVEGRQTTPESGCTEEDV
jgi:hypothetical protein